MGGYTTVSARLDSQVKHDAEEVLQALGLTHSAAISALYSQIAMQKAIPFELKMPPQLLSIDTIRAAVSKAAKRYGAAGVWLFGSYARGEAQEKSDVDLLVDIGDIRGVELGGLLDDIEQDLGVSVDIMTTDTIPDRMKDRVARDKVLLYER